MIRSLLFGMTLLPETWNTAQENCFTGVTYHRYLPSKNGPILFMPSKKSFGPGSRELVLAEADTYNPAVSQPAEVVYRNLGFEAAFKELLKAFETDFKAINLGAMEKSRSETYKGGRYHTDIRIPGCNNSYLELIDIKKNKTFVSNSVFTGNQQEVLALYEKIKNQFDKIDFGKLADLVEDDMTTTPPPISVLKMASYKALGMEPGMSEKMGEVQIDIQLWRDVNYDIANLNKPPTIKYFVSVRIGEQ